MNEYCKKYLMHSWGTSPERKELEREYNTNYYKTNKQRILQRAAQRRINQTNRTNVDDIVIAPFTLYEDGDEFVYYSKKAASDTVNAGLTVVSSIKKTSDSIKKGIKFVSDKLKTPIELIKKSKLAKSIAKFFNKAKYYYSQSTI